MFGIVTRGQVLFFNNFWLCEPDFPLFANLKFQRSILTRPPSCPSNVLKPSVDFPYSCSLSNKYGSELELDDPTY